MSAGKGNRRMGNADGIVVDGHPDHNSEGAAARVRMLGGGLAELTVLPASHTFPGIIVIDRMAAGGLIVELLRVWAYHPAGGVAALHAANDAVEEARNSGDGTVPLHLIDALTKAVRQTVPSEDLAGGA